MKQIKSIVVNKLLLLILLLALILRLINLDFPVLTAEEARIASRANFLVNYGKDELGRKFPFIFNSAYDYQLPLTSYITTFGELIFGKNDLGVRIPFILMGVLIVALTYFISKIIFKDNRLAYFSAIIAATSPGLIFFSKIPNEYIVLTTLILVLILLFLQKEINKFFIITAVILLLITSKFAWFITMPIILLSLFLRSDLNKREKINLILLCGIPTILMIFIFINIPQGVRSLIENNFAAVSDISIKNGIERLRGQVTFGWPQIYDRILLNKSFFAVASFFNWLSHFQPSNLFGQLDPSLRFGFLNMGVLQKVIIVPFLAGIYFSIKDKKTSQLMKFVFLIIAVSYPSLFIYPNYEVGFIILSLPFIILITAVGFKNFTNKLSLIVILVAALEININLFSIDSDKKAAQNIRPLWVKEVAQDSYTLSLKKSVFILDDIVSDFMPYLMWYTPTSLENTPNIGLPYKVNQTYIGNIKIINPDRLDFDCASNNQKYIFIGQGKFQSFKNNVIKVFKDGFDEDRIYLVESAICII